MMLVKYHNKDEKEIVAVCDKELFGTKIEEGNKQLDLTSEFYNGEERDEKEIGDIIRNADIVNLVGERAIKLGLEEGIIDDSNVVIVDGVPSAQAIIVLEG